MSSFVRCIVLGTDKSCRRSDDGLARQSPHVAVTVGLPQRAELPGIEQINDCKQETFLVNSVTVGLDVVTFNIAVETSGKRLAL